MMWHTLGAFQLPSAFTKQIMNRIDQLRPTTTPLDKPLMPWLAAMTTLVIALFLGLGQRPVTRLLRPYSLDAPETSVQVELIDAPAMYRPETNPALVNQSGRFNPKNEKLGVRPDSTALGATSTAAEDKALNDSEWVQTNGPSGGEVTRLFRASDGALYAATDSPGVFRSDTNGDTWVAVKEGLDVYPGGQLAYAHTIAEADGVIYLNDENAFFYSNTRGESWHRVKYPDRNKTMTPFAVSGRRIYIDRDKDGVVYSDDHGKSWTPINSGLPTKSPDKLMTVGTTLFAKIGDNLFRLRDGETNWTKITKFQDLRFFIVAQGALIIGNQFDLRRSTDEGDSWAPMTGKIRIWSWENKDVKVDIPWPRVPIELEFRSLSIQGIAAFGNTISILLSDGSLIRSTENGRWSTTETGLTSLELWDVNSMVALSIHAVCVATNNGVFRWTDGEKSWRQINKGIVNTWVYDLAFFKNALYAIPGGNAIVKSVDGGNRWTPIHQGLPTTIARALAVSDDTLYLGLQDTNFDRRKPSTAGIFRLADDEDSWIPVQTEMRTHDQYHQLSGVDELAISGDSFYVLTYAGIHQRLFRWRKGEQYWMEISPDVDSSPDGGWKGLSVVGKTIYFNTNGNLMRSNDEGKTWSRIDTFLGHDDPSKLIRGPIALENDVYIAVTELGVFRSANRGKTWESVNEGLPHALISSLHSVENMLYAEVFEGIFRLRTDGHSWEFVTPGLLPGANALVAGNNMLYAATGGQGVYRIDPSKSDND